MTARNADEEIRRFARLLRLLASLLDNLSPEELDELLRGRASLVIDRRSRTEIGQEHVSAARPLPNFTEIIDRLRSFRSREEGAALLADTQLTRRELETLARQLGLAILRSDNIERLEAKIIESCIGAKLSSEAIRGPQKVRG